MKAFTTNTLIFGVLIILAGFGSMYVSISIIDTLPNSWSSWLLIAIICWSIGIGILISDIFYNRRNRRTLVNDKKYWVLGIFFILLALNILNMTLNNPYKETPEDPRYEYWNNSFIAFGAIIPAGFAFCAFYVIMKKRKLRHLGIKSDF